MTEKPGWVDNFGKCPRCFPRTGGKHCVCPDPEKKGERRHRETELARDGAVRMLACRCGETWPMTVLM